MSSEHGLATYTCTCHVHVHVHVSGNRGVFDPLPRLFGVVSNRRQFDAIAEKDRARARARKATPMSCALPIGKTDCILLGHDLFCRRSDRSIAASDAIAATKQRCRAPFISRPLENIARPAIDRARARKATPMSSEHGLATYTCTCHVHVLVHDLFCRRSDRSIAASDAIAATKQRCHAPFISRPLEKSARPAIDRARARGTSTCTKGHADEL